MFNSAYYFKKKLISIHLFIWYFSTVTWIKRKEMSSWENSVLDLPEFLSLLTCWLVVLMSNKFLWLSIMIYPQTEKITFTGNCPKKIFFQNRTSKGILKHFFQIHDEKPDPITEISVDILQLFTLWSKNSNLCHLFGNSQYMHTNLTYIFF